MCVVRLCSFNKNNEIFECCSFSFFFSVVLEFFCIINLIFFFVAGFLLFVYSWIHFRLRFKAQMWEHWRLSKSCALHAKKLDCAVGEISVVWHQGSLVFMRMFWGWFWVFCNRLSLSDLRNCVRLGSFRKVAHPDFALDYGIQDNITRANKYI